MDFSKLKGKIFFNKKFIKSNKANIHVLNHSLHFATSVFEGIRVYEGKILFLKDHIQRLINSSKIMKLKLNIANEKICKICLKLIKLNKIKNGYIRPIVFRSSHSMSPETVNCQTIIAIACWEWGNLFGKDKGVSLDISRYPRLNRSIYPIEAKSSGSYQTSVISRIESAKKKFDDCIMLDLNKNIAESSACNIFWVKNNKVFTPKRHSILDGITRNAIIKICKNNKISLIEGNFKLPKILKSDSAFLTGTAAEIQIIKKIKNKKLDIQNKIVSFLKEKFELVKKDCPSKVSNIKY